jgi:predicted nucleic acid-binding protein
MRFWDSSAVVPLVVAESATPALNALLREDGVMLVWWGTMIECASAIARREREGALSSAATSDALDRLRAFSEAWQEVQPAHVVRRMAIRLLRVHQLRATDALQLAAALVVAESDPTGVPFVSLDDRLNEAAAREGFSILPV